jgi:hypothetical protein
MRLINSLNKTFFDIKANRVITDGDRNKSNWLNINKLELPNNTPVEVWFKDLEMKILLFKQVFINKDASTAVRYLATNNLNLTSKCFINIYKKRWSVEEYHKSIKQNTCAEKSPARTIQTQSAHLFSSLLAYVKLERHKISTKMNHFMLKNKLYTEALKVAFKKLAGLNVSTQNYENTLASA